MGHGCTPDACGVVMVSSAASVSKHRRVKDPGPLLRPDRRRRTTRRVEEIERELRSLLTKQHRTIDIDTALWIEQAATAKVNLEVIGAMRSRNQDVPHEQQAKQSTDLARALRALKLKATALEPAAPKPVMRPFSELLREAGKL